MTEEDEALAGEYVLGTLSGPEREAFARRLPNDAALSAAVSQWESRLAPLADTAAPVSPPPHVWPAIERSIGASQAGTQQPSNVIDFRKRLNRWKAATAVLGALAAGLAGIVVLDGLSVPPEAAPGRYVAVVNSDGHEPALIAEVDTATGLIRIRSLAATTPEGRSLELWHIPEGGSAKSLGVLQAGSEAQTIREAVERGPVDGIIAVTVEPEGGSPTGQATGPIVYTGRLVPIE